MYSLISAIRRGRRLSSTNNRFEEQASNMSVEALTDLTNDVLENNATREELDQIAVSIEKAEVELQKAQKAERFIAMRLESYRQKLSQKRQDLGDFGVQTEENKTNKEGEIKKLIPVEENQESAESVCDSSSESIDDIEEGNKPQNLTEEQRLIALQKLKEEEEALRKVENGQYLELQETVRQLQRKIFLFQRRQEEILDKAEECKSFLVASAMVEGQQEMTIEGNEEDSTDRST